MKIRNNSIDIFRLVSAILVVSIHTVPLVEVNHNISYIITYIIPRIAVPFFFCVSGYYYVKKLKNSDDVKNILINTLKKLLVVYIIWSIIYFAKDFIIILKNNDSIYNFIIKCIKNFFIYGSYIQLWYFPALMYSLIIITIFIKRNHVKILFIISIILYIIGCLGCSWYVIGNYIPLINKLINGQQFIVIRRIFLTGLPFTVLGYFINSTEQKFNIKNRRNLLILSILLFIIENTLVIHLNLQKNVVISLSLYVFLYFIMINLLTNPMNYNEKISNFAYYSRGIANFTYYVHPLFIGILDNFNLSNTIIFITTIFLTIIIGIIIVKINNKNLNKLIY